MNLLDKIFSTIKSLLGHTMTFNLVDFDGNTVSINQVEIFTIIEDAYTIYVIFNDKSYRVFPSTILNKNNLPNIRLAQKIEAKF